MESARSGEAFWRHAPDVSPPAPPGRRYADITRSNLSLRDVLLCVVGACGMYGAQISVQWGMRSDIRDLKTAFDSYQRQQSETNTVIQRQIDDWRQETKLNRVNIENTDRVVAELKGLLVGAGIKGVPK